MLQMSSALKTAKLDIMNNNKKVQNVERNSLVLNNISDAIQILE